MHQTWWLIGIAALGLSMGWVMDGLATRLVEPAPGRWGRWVSGPLLALALVCLFHLGGPQWLTLSWAVLTCLLLCVALCDCRAFLIPNVLVLAGVLWALACIVVLPLLAGEGWRGVGAQLLSSLVATLGITLPVYLLALVMDRFRGRSSLGGGDIKLLFMLGLFFPLQLGLLGLFLACILGVLMSLLPWTGADHTEGIEGAEGIEVAGKALGKPIPFGGALALAFYLVMLLECSLVPI